jgi:hypothetical protein
LPVLKRPLGDDGQQEIMLGPQGGVIVTTRIGSQLSSGIWVDGHYQELKYLGPPPEDEEGGET